MAKVTRGPVIENRVWCFIKALLALELEPDKFKDIKIHWEKKNTDRPELVVDTERRYLETYTKLKKHEITTVINLLGKGELDIWDDRRLNQNQGSEIGNFALKLWSFDEQKNHEEFKKLWEHHKSPKSKDLEAIYKKNPKTAEVVKAKFDWRDCCRKMLPTALSMNPLLSGDGVVLTIDDIVPLELVERKQRPKIKEDFSPENFQQQLPSEDEIPITHQQFFEQVLKQGNSSKSQGRNIAIIGEPGSGKSTLLQEIANWIAQADELPIFVKLADIEKINLEEYLLENWIKNATKKLDISEDIKKEFVEQFKADRVWLLLDGVDEMELSNNLLLSSIDKYLKGWVANARIVITCRLNVWDADKNSLYKFDAYRTKELSYPQMVQDFISHFFCKADEVTTGQKLIQKLEQSSTRIKDLIKNPLRLTLLCRTWKRRQGELPQTKAELYKQFVETLYDWKDQIQISPEQRQLLEKALGKLAKKAINRQGTKFRLRETFIREEFDKFDKSLFDLACQLGWLNKWGMEAGNSEETVYAFFHPTFQEYFAALQVNNWREFFNHIPNNPTQGVYRIFEPQWKEVILLWFGREEENLKQQKQQFIDALVKFQDGCGNFYWFRAYFLAGSGIAEFKDCRITDEIVNRIVEWDNNNCLVKEEARSLIQETPHTKIIDALVKHLLNLVDDLGNKPETVRFYYLNQLSYRISSLEKIGIGNEKAINALIKLLNSKYVTENESCLHKLIMTLKQICTGEENNIKALLLFLESQGKNRDSLTQIIKNLRERGRKDKQLIFILVNMIKPEDMYDYNHYQTEKLSYKKWQQASNLVKNEPNNQIGIDALVELLESSNVDTDIHRAVASSLGKIELGHQKAIDALVRRLQLMDDDEDTLCEVVNSLGYIGKKNKKAIDELVKLLDSTNLDDYTCRLVAECLGKIDPGNKKAIDALANLLTSEYIDDNMLRLVAESLGKIDPGNKKALDTLIKLLDSVDENNGISWFVPDSLRQILQQNQSTTVVTKLSRYLNSSQLENYYNFYENVLWDCAQNLTYPDFYQAWHAGENSENLDSPSETFTPQNLQAAINSDRILSQTIHLICIDTSKFIDPNNPASKIYTEIVKAGCPKCEDGTPKTMTELQTYWDLLESDKPVVLVFYQGVGSQSPQLSDRILDDIRKFDKAICVTGNQTIDDILNRLRSL